MSLFDEEGEKKLRMSHLAIVGSHSLNGVSVLHTEILRSRLFKEFYELWPERFSNKTNGISPRRWLSVCNPGLSELISEFIGHGWVTDLEWLEKLVPYADEPGFRRRWREVKQENKRRLARTIRTLTGITVDEHSLFDCQVKRIHEYKRQLLNVLRLTDLSLRITDNPQGQFLPRTLIFGGKAAPGYFMAKLIIRLINALADKVNDDAAVGGRLKVVFLPNYGVSLAEQIVPAADLSEQLATAGTEASGTSNMKFALNGALTIGTLDGANVEIRSAVGPENFFLFGLTAEQVEERRKDFPGPVEISSINPRLRRVLEYIGGGGLSPDRPDLFAPVVGALLQGGDPYMLLADFDSYVECQERVSAAWLDTEAWTRTSILNVARMGWFSSDRTIREYAQQVWGVSSTPVTMEPSKP
jgi:starch phosphorylase